jgi:hypothetical protein
MTMADRGRDREAIRNVGEPSSREAVRPASPESSGQPTDVGRTSGGGSLGHDQPPGDQNRIRNEGTHGRSDLRDREPPDPLPELEP